MSLRHLRKGATMLDVILLALGLAFFALSIGYAYACDRL
jgi:SNF family Na+-dependent transporter